MYNNITVHVTCNKYSEKFVFAIYFIKNLLFFLEQHSVIIFA